MTDVEVTPVVSYHSAVDYIYKGRAEIPHSQIQVDRNIEFKNIYLANLYFKGFIAGADYLKTKGLINIDD